jgi:predicted Zn-dependent protease
MFQKLLDERKTRPTGVDAWFATHPLEENRIADTRRMINQIDPAILATLTSDTQNFQAFKRRVASLPPSPPPSRRRAN